MYKNLTEEERFNAEAAEWAKGRQRALVAGEEGE